MFLKLILAAEKANTVFGRVDSTFVCQAGSTRSNITVAQVNNPPQPLYCLHEGYLESEPAVYMLIQRTPLWLEKASAVPDRTLRFTAQASESAGE